MPQQCVILVRVALANLALGISMGSLLLAGKVLPMPPAIAALRPLHMELLMFGFMVQLAFGVALWILPRTPVVRGENLSWLAGVLLNMGLWLVGLVGGTLSVPAAGAIGRLIELVAMLIFGYQIWPRIRKLRHTHTTP